MEETTRVLKEAIKDFDRQYVTGFTLPSGAVVHILTSGGERDRTTLAAQATPYALLCGVTADSSEPRIYNMILPIVAEFIRAKKKHGDKTPDVPDVPDVERLACLGEEYGEVCRALTYDKDHAGALRKELIQVAAMAAAWASILPEGA